MVRRKMETITIIAAVAASTIVSINPMQFGINPLQLL
jgi:hypothetical protein